MQTPIKMNGIRLLGGENGSLTLIVDIDKQSSVICRNSAQNAADALANSKEYGISFQPISKRRSLDANAYFHVLCDKIAEKMSLSMDDVKVNLVVSYGTPKYIVSVPNDAVISDIWAYSRYVGEVDGQAQYMLYKQTHTLTSAEMARLINGAIQEAKQLGIETLTPQELALLNERWEVKNAN